MFRMMKHCRRWQTGQFGFDRKLFKRMLYKQAAKNPTVGIHPFESGEIEIKNSCENAEGC